MTDRVESFRLTLLDIGSIVMGAAIAAVHVRLVVSTPQTWLMWVWESILFGWVGLTSIGPFLFLARSWRRAAIGNYPLVGDRLWVIWGCPWVLTAVLKATLRRPELHPGQLDPAYVGSLGLGLFLATMITVPILVARVLWGSPATPQRPLDVNLTQWVGLGLTAIWPIQCGVGLVVMG